MDPVQLIIDTDNLRVAMYCPVREVAFGPVAEGPVALDMMQRFIDMLPADPRIFSPVELDTFWVAMQQMIDGEATTIIAPVGTSAVAVATPPAPVDGAADGDHQPPAGDAGETPTPTPMTGMSSDDGVFQDRPADPTIGNPFVTQPDAPQSTPVEMVPIGKRKCWACDATGHEPDKPTVKCGICDGEKYLPV